MACYMKVHVILLPCLNVLYLNTSISPAHLGSWPFLVDTYEVDLKTQNKSSSPGSQG